VENGLLSAEQAAGLSEREALWLIFRSGFSTKQEVTDVSGRGVGMDVVREQMEQLHGRIDVESELGKGTRFTLTLPLSVATARCLLVRAADQTFALPINNIDRIVSVTGKDTQSAEGKNTIEVDGAPVLLAALADVLGMADTPQKKDARPAIVISGGEKKIAVAIDELLGAQEIALKKLPAPLIRVPFISGATIIGTGEVVCILTVNDIMRSVLGAGAATSLTARTAAAPTPSDLHATEGQKILVADDSVTIRTLQTSLLRSAGYIVDAACDGQEAWEMLNRDHYDIVVSDVEMPNMTGFDLTQKVRGDSKLKDKPVVLVTTLASEEDQKRGIAAGADAYIIKGSKEQAKLLETVARLIS
jgi:two-component system chemotaxis sensor kinase CheA